MFLGSDRGGYPPEGHLAAERPEPCSRKLLGLIILDLGVDVHRNFAVLVTREVLHRFGIDRGIYQIGDICVAKLMRGNLEVQTIHHMTAMYRTYSVR